MSCIDAKNIKGLQQPTMSGSAYVSNFISKIASILELCCFHGLLINWKIIWN